MGAPGKEHLIPENTFVIYYNLNLQFILQFKSDEYKTDHFLENIYIIKTKIK